MKGGARLAALLALIVCAPAGCGRREAPPAGRTPGSAREGGGAGAVAGAAPEAGASADAYAPPESCAGCHRSIAESYASVAMARSFGPPATRDVIEDYTRGALLEHPASGFTYAMRRDGDRVTQTRFERGARGRKVRVFEREVTFAIGSGRHARSYLHRGAGGELTELPVTWYTQEKRWGMSPGYERANQPDFFRTVKPLCIFCHTGYPAMRAAGDPVAPAAVFPADLPSGIDCQRCHGPGARHAELASRPGIDFAQVRAAIVNPRRLSSERQLDICMQCHLETTSDGQWPMVVRFGRDVFSFRPGEDLAAYRIHFDQPPGAGREDKFEIAHQAYRLRQSRCFRESGGRLVCTTCHDPHRRPEDPVAAFSAKCLECHRADQCGPTRAAAGHGGAGPCVTCHMPKRRTDDVVHVVMTDHRIGLHPDARTLLAPRSEATPYRGPIVLYRPEEIPAGDERDLYLGFAGVLDGVDVTHALPMLERALGRLRPRAAAPYVALGIARLAMRRPEEAVGALREAVAIEPDNPQALRTLGNALNAAGHPQAALENYNAALAAWPDDSEAATSVGAQLFKYDKLPAALGAFDRAIALRADNAAAHANRGAVLLALGHHAEAIAALSEALRIDPRDATGYDNLAMALQHEGRENEEVDTLRDGLRRDPSNPRLQTRLAFILATSPESRRRNGAEARALAEQAVSRTARGDPFALDALAAALAESGQAAQAAAVAQEAKSLASRQGREDLASEIEARLTLYRRGAPYHRAGGKR